MQPTSKLKDAIELANHGLSVIPLHPNAKIPCVTWAPYQSRKASEDELKQWFSNFPDRNVGVVTGAISNVVVLDVDKPEAFNLSMPQTPTVKTGKGLHYYFAHPGFDVGNAALPFGDLRGDGGQVVAPPSKHPNGSSYEWLSGLSFDDVALAELPSELIELAFKPAAEIVSKAANDNQPVDTTAYGKAWFSDVEALAKCRDGGRNNMLNTVACKAGSLFAAGQLNRREAIDAMLKACRSNGLMIDRENGGSKRVTATIMSGFDAGVRKPREVAEIEPAVIEPSKPGKLNIVRLSDVRPEKIDWIWPGVLAKGKLSLFAGQGGVGKSTLVADVAARITTGSNWPTSNHKAEPGTVVIIQLEDGLADTVLPRFLAAGGDHSRVVVVSTVQDEKTEESRPFNLQSDLSALSEVIRDLSDVRLIVIDPIMGYMGNLNPDKADQVRKITTPLQILAQETDASVLIVAHNNKSEDKRAINSVQGSGAFVQAVRTAFNIYKDEANEVRRIMAPLKSNVGKDNQSFAFTIEQRQVSDNGLTVDTSAIVWDSEAHKGTAEDVLQNARGGPAVREAREFLGAFLHSGPKSYKDVVNAAKELKISTPTLYRARDDLKIYSVPVDDVPMWTLPEAA